MLWLLESGLVAIARLLLYLRLLGQVTNLFPQLTRRLSAGEPHARVRGPCAQFGGMGLEHVQQPLPVALVVPDASSRYAAIPGTYAGAAAYRDEASRITLDHVRKPFQERIDRLSGRLAGERFNQRFAERLERNLDAARTLKPRRHRIRHTR